MDGARGPTGQLLKDDRPDERAEAPVGVAGPVLDRSDEPDEVSEHGIASRDVVDRGGQRGRAHATPLSGGRRA